ncbi:hypothetical protein HCB18_24405 [Salinispora arenicola]|uniref:hypothetical protein n=1 Tax=Salinispora arenicola TaxID=168697 RepID=UPI001692FC06|nr:hypothetical protein [Salinispora arenicola]NIL59661.1 hypothetical protein [Salinispora arenicola]
MTTRWEVEAALETVDMEPTGRHIMLRLLTRCVAATAEIPVQHAPTFTELAGATGYSRSAVAEWMKVLAASGWARRTTAVANVKSGYQLAIGGPSVVLPKRESRKPRAASGGPPSGPGVNAPSPSDGDSKRPLPAQVVRSADQFPARSGPLSGPHPSASGPLSGPEVVRSADQSGPLSGPPDGASPITGFKTFTNTDHPPRPDKPTNSGGQQAAAKHTPTKAPPSHSATPQQAVGRQQKIRFPRTATLPRATEIILNSLKSANPGVSVDDANAVHRAVCAEYGPKVNLGYLSTMAANSSFSRFLDAIRRDRAEHVEAQIRAIQQTHPDCEHGTAAGNQPHPTTGALLCPWCRCGTQLPADVQRERTHPAVAAAVTIYRQSVPRAGVAELLRFTQQATVLHRHGLTADQLADHARQAAARTPAP